MLSQLAAAESRHRRVGVHVRWLMSAGRHHSLPYARQKTCFHQAANSEDNSWSNYNEGKVNAHVGF